MEPYRKPVEIETGQELVVAEKTSLGAVREVHAPPPLYKALVFPCLSGLVIGVAIAVFGGGPVAGLIFGVIVWLLFLLATFRSRALRVTVYDRGVVLARRRGESPVAFEDIDEIWFELAWFKARQQSPDLHGLRLVGFDATVHRVPLTSIGGLALCNAILEKHAGPLAADARKALAAGETLRFGRVRIDRTGITVRGAYRPWSELRSAEVHPTRVYLYRVGLPLVAWRTIRLDRIPNPSVFWQLLGPYVKVTEIRVPTALKIS